MNKVKLILAVVAISAFFLSGIYFRVQELLFADKLDQIEMQIKNQVSSLVLAYQSDVRFLQKWIYAVQEEGAKKINWNAMSPYFAVAQLNSNLQVIEWSFREKSPVSSITKENLTQLVNSFNVKAKTINKDIKYYIYTDPEKKKIFLTILTHGEKIWLFASQGENLQSVMDVQKTSPFMLTLINSDFLSLANIKTEYIGQKIFENNILNEIKSGTKISQSGTYSIKSGEEFFAFFEKVPDSDLYVYSQVSLTELNNSKRSIKNQFIIFSMGFLIIITSLLILLYKPQEKMMMPLKGKISSANEEMKLVGPDSPAGAEVIPVVKATTGVVSGYTENMGNLEKSKIENYMKLAAVVGNEIKVPIVKMLNLTSSLINQTQNSGEKDNLKNIQNEIRSTKEIVDKLLVFSGEKSNDRIETKIDTAILRALKGLEPQLSMKAIKVERKFQDLPAVNIDVNKVATAFENILRNSIQALERKPDKKIEIKTYQKEKKICIEIVDNGSGLDKESQNKIFEPFYTTFDQKKNMGLGLSIALGVIRNHEGNILVESEKGKGTKMIIEIPMAIKENSNADTPPSESNILTGDKSPALPPTPVEDKKSQKEDLVDLMSQMEAHSDAVVTVDDSEGYDDGDSEGKSSGAEEEEKLVLEGLVFNEKPAALNVNVDELFDMQEEVATADLVMPPVPKPNEVTPEKLIVPPKIIPKKSAKASEEFKVVIRKPKGSA